MPIVQCAHRAQPSTLTWSRHTMWSSLRSRKVRQSLCPLYSGVVIDDGDVVVPAWRCESCRQTTLVDGVVPRSAPRRFGEPHSSVNKIDGCERGRMRQFYKAVAFEEVFMVGCVSPIAAGRYSCDSISDISAETVTKYSRVFCRFQLFPVVKVSRYVLVMSTGYSS